MHTLSLLFSLALSSVSPAAVEEQISESRVQTLECRAWNAMGVSSFQFNGSEVESVTNGFIRQSYRLSNMGNSREYGFGYVNLSNGRNIVSFAFPSQSLSAGKGTYNGILFLNAFVNPFQPVVGMGTPWAQVSCTVGVKAR